MATMNMVGEVIAASGTDEQKHAYNPKLASGEYMAGSFLASGRRGERPMLAA
jgi:alkylation response protein AidB-like acyl-CoA dehydrogenase